MFEIPFVPESANNSNPEATEYTPLKTNLYDAVCVGVVSRMMKRWLDDEKELKFILVFQVIGEDNTVHFVKSKPFKPSMYEKSGLFKFLSSWTGKQTPAEVIAELSADTNANFSLESVIGKAAKLLVTEDKVGEATYNNIGNVLINTTSVDVAPSNIPPYIVTGATGYKFHPDINSNLPLAPDLANNS